MPNCRHCGQEFGFSEKETKLHEKLSSSLECGAVPEQVICSDCRMQEKMAWRNERTLYRRKCDKTGKDIISTYSPDVAFPVYERNAWYADDWDPMEYGKKFDPALPFFEQFALLQQVVPRIALFGKNTENSDYCNFAFDSRNCYLTHCCYYAEGMLSSYWMLRGKDCMNCSLCFKCEQCLDCVDCNGCYNCKSSTLSSSCNDCSFLYDCRGCHDCFGCVGLRQKSFCFFNEQMTEEDYREKLRSINLNKPEAITEVKNRLRELELTLPHRYSAQEQCENATGDHLTQMKDCENCYQAFTSRDCVNCSDAEDVVDALDCLHPGWSTELVYNGYSGIFLKFSAFFAQCGEGDSMFYCDNCYSCSHCFGCISLRRKKYCILNTQYTKEEYEKLLPEIVASMKKTEEWGKYFPRKLSPFCYNETIANEFFPLTKEQAIEEGLRWQDDVPATTGKETIAWESIPQNSKDVPNAIIKEVLVCETCQRNFKIVQQELDFYRSKEFPLDHRCPDCRHLDRIALRNPRKLYDRTCMKCSNAIRTTYAPNRPEIVYCERCYLESVY